MYFLKIYFLTVYIYQKYVAKLYLSKMDFLKGYMRKNFKHWNIIFYILRISLQFRLSHAKIGIRSFILLAYTFIMCQGLTIAQKIHEVNL